MEETAKEQSRIKVTKAGPPLLIEELGELGKQLQDMLNKWK